MSGGVFMLVAARDLRLAGRRRFEALLPVVFFIVAASLFPLGVGPEPQVLRERLKEPERHPHSERLCVVLVRP